MDKELARVVTMAFVSVSVVLLVLFACLSGFSYAAGKWQCDNYAQMNPSQQFSFGVATGCMVRHGDVWIPYYNIRGLE